MSISLSSEENSLLKEINKGKTLLSLLLALTISPLMFNHCLRVKFLINRWWKLLLSKYLDSNIDLIMWFNSRDCVLS